MNLIIKQFRLAPLRQFIVGGRRALQSSRLGHAIHNSFVPYPAPFWRSGIRRFSVDLGIPVSQSPATATESAVVSTVSLGDGIKGTKIAPEGQYILGFTCNKCDHRTARKFSKKSYHKGVVLIRCPGCRSIHLIADNLAWFGEKSVNIETLMAEKGEAIIKDLKGGREYVATKCDDKHYS